LAAYSYVDVFRYLALARRYCDFLEARAREVGRPAMAR